MRVLVFDTETTGLPQKDEHNKYYPIYNTQKWPHIIQISFILYDTKRKRIINNHDHIIKLAKSVKIGEESIGIHGITRQDSENNGIKMATALNMFNAIIQEADIIIAHNISFDKQVIMVESIRNNLTINFSGGTHKILQYCTMKNSIDLCKLERTGKNGRTYNKFPTLLELHKHLFQTSPKNLHNSFIDILICLRCFCLMEFDTDVYEECRQIHNYLNNII
jgi:DNA polymerase III subunit epsilon